MDLHRIAFYFGGNVALAAINQIAATLNDVAAVAGAVATMLFAAKGIYELYLSNKKSKLK